MNPRLLTIGLAWTVLALFLTGCSYDSPITAAPTRVVNEGLLGTWSTADGKSRLKIVRLDDRSYIVLSGDDLYRVYHSDFEGLPLVSVASLESKRPTYAYWSWELGADGTLILRNLNDKLIPDTTSGVSAVQALVRKYVNNPELLQKPLRMRKET